MTRTFDCVAQNRKVQEQLLEEYEARKAEFASYADFVRTTTLADPRVQAFRKRVAESRRESP